MLFFSCYKKLSLSLFVFREKQMLHKHCFVHTIYLVKKEKCKLIDTRDETLRRKSSGGITDGLNWLKRHHNFSFFFIIKFFLYIFLHIFILFFFVMFLHLNVVWWHDLYAKINTENPRRLCCFHVRFAKYRTDNSCCFIGNDSSLEFIRIISCQNWRRDF